VTNASTPPLPRPRRLKTLAWAAVWLALGALSLQFLLGVYAKYRQVDPESYTMFWTRQGWLWTHLTGGALTVALGPVQFLTRWPRAHPRLHRWSGRLYVLGIIVGLVGATGLISTSPAPTEIRVAFAATALAWFCTASVALAAIYRNQVATHRRWMTRNYLVTLAPITFRLLLPASIAMGLMPSPVLIAQLLWLSWVLPLLGYEAVRFAARSAVRSRHTSSLLSEPHRTTP
jgi:uncharacterized membrane protein